MKVQIVNKSKHDVPQYHTAHAACWDAQANLEQPVTLKPLERALIPTGLYIALPLGYEMQVRPRSGLAINYGISLVNAPGTIDADYRGEIKVIMINLGQEEYVVKDGDRIAQMLVSRCERVEWEEVDQLDTTDRGDGAFGHTGK